MSSEATDFTWNMDVGGERYTSEQARAWLHDTVTRKNPVSLVYDDLVQLSRHSGVRPTLVETAMLNDRSRLMDSPEWQTLPDRLRAWLMWVDDSEIPAITDAVVNAVIHYYRGHQEV